MLITSQVDVRKIIARRLKAAREKAGYTSAEDFCEKHGFLLDHYRKHENGTLAMVASEIIPYCSALNISICYLMLGEEVEELKKQRPTKTKNFGSE